MTRQLDWNDAYNALIGSAAITIGVSFAIEGYWLVRRRWRWSWSLSICVTIACVLLTINAAVVDLPTWTAIGWIAATGSQCVAFGMQLERWFRDRRRTRPSRAADQEIAEAVRRHDQRSR